MTHEEPCAFSAFRGPGRREEVGVQDFGVQTV